MCVCVYVCNHDATWAALFKIKGGDKRRDFNCDWKENTFVA